MNQSIMGFTKKLSIRRKKSSKALNEMEDPSVTHTAPPILPSIGGKGPTATSIGNSTITSMAEFSSNNNNNNSNGNALTAANTGREEEAWAYATTSTANANGNNNNGDQMSKMSSIGQSSATGMMMPSKPMSKQSFRNNKSGNSKANRSALRSRSSGSSGSSPHHHNMLPSRDNKNLQIPLSNGKSSKSSPHRYANANYSENNGGKYPHGLPTSSSRSTKPTSNNRTNSNRRREGYNDNDYNEYASSSPSRKQQGGGGGKSTNKSAAALRLAMRKEMSRHRAAAEGGENKGQYTQQQQQPSSYVGSVPQGRGSRGERGSNKSRGLGRGSGYNSQVSNVSASKKSSGKGNGSKGNGSKGSSRKSGAVVVTTTAAMAMALQQSRSKSISYDSDDDTTKQTLDDSDSNNANPTKFPEETFRNIRDVQNDDADDDDDDDHNEGSHSSFCSFGETYETEYDELIDNRTKVSKDSSGAKEDDNSTYDGTYHGTTCEDDDDDDDDDGSTVDSTYNGDEHTVDSYGDSVTLDSYVTYDNTHDNDDDDESEANRRATLDNNAPNANSKNSTWGSWFGFSKKKQNDDNNEESLMTASVISPGEEDRTVESVDGDSHTSGTSTLLTRDSAGNTIGSASDDDEETVDDKKDEAAKLAARGVAAREKEAAEKKATESNAAGLVAGVAAGAAMGLVAGVAAASATTSEKDSATNGIPPGKPVRKVASFKKKWKKLKGTSPANGTTNESVIISINNDVDSLAKRDDQSRTTTETPVTAASTAKTNLEDSNDDDGEGGGGGGGTAVLTKMDQSEKSGRTVKHANNAASAMARSVDKDERQRDIYCKEHGEVENLTIRQYADVPTPDAPDHILIKVLASTVTPQDCVDRIKGDPSIKPEIAVPGYHIVGQVHAMGSLVNASMFRIGDRVAALLPQGGGNTKYISIPKKSVILLPEDASHEDIICLVANYMTAYQCLKLAKNDGAPLTYANVLITGGSGPVGQALVELALREGAKVYATAHKMHEEHLTKLGAKWFSIKPKKWLPFLEGKMDVVIDSLCVDGYDSSYRALTPDGILVCNTGNHSALQLQHQNDPAFCLAFDENDINSWWSSVKAKYVWKRAVFYDVNESYEKNPKMFGHELHYLIYKLQRGEVSPKVAGKVSLNQVPKAQKLIEKGLPNGTVICLPWKKLDPKQATSVENSNSKNVSNNVVTTLL